MRSVLIALYVVVILIGIARIILFHSSTRIFTLSHNKTSNETYRMPSKDVFTRCLLDAQDAFSDLSLRWFLTFGTALMYHRSKNFISNDIDIGIFYNDLLTQNITEKQIILTLTKNNFKLFAKYGKRNDGRGLTWICPRSNMHFGIFVFYRINFKIKSDKSYLWWTASYNGPCVKMPYRKCRRGFSDIKLQHFDMHGKSFYVVSQQFLIDQYGSTWIIPRQYTYAQSISIMTNLLDKF